MHYRETVSTGFRGKGNRGQEEGGAEIKEARKWQLQKYHLALSNRGLCRVGRVFVTPLCLLETEDSAELVGHLLPRYASLQLANDQCAGTQKPGTFLSLAYFNFVR